MPEHFFSGFRRRLPLILQTEAAECGLACLAMIANYLGHKVDMPSMRRRFPTSARGTTLSQIIANAHSLGLDSRPLRVEMEHMRRLETPCVLHWNLNHFVVLKSATSKYVEIHDPASGHRRMSLEEAGKHFTGVVLELLPRVDFHPVKEQERISIQDVTGSFLNVKGALAQVFLLALTLEVIVLLIPLYMQTVLDQVVVTTDTRLLSLLGYGFLFVVAFRSLLVASRGWAITYISGKLSAQWAANLFSHLMRLSIVFFERRRVGDIISRFESLQTIQQTLTGKFVVAVIDGVMGIMALVILFIYSATLTGLILLGLAVYTFSRWLTYRKLWRANEEQIVYSARRQTSLVEAIRGVQAVKLANKQSDRSARFANINLQAVQRSVVAQRLGFVFSSLNQWLFGTLRIIIIWIAARQVILGDFSIGMLVAFVTYADELASRFGGLVDKLIDFRMLRLHVERISDIALTKPEDTVIERGSALVEDEAEIEVDNVSFRYSDNEPWILKNCSFRISAGECVAVTGPSGCGKTTLAKLLLGLLEPSEGAIRFKGVDIRQYGIWSYRESIGAVMQDDVLFEGSIADNIAFFDDGATPSRVEAAASQAAIHDEILAMPMAYETLVGDMGSTLSGGQKQRVLLARAFYRKPHILVLDEATSHLDLDRERIINCSTKRSSATRIIIAHRPETILGADRVIPYPVWAGNPLG